MSHDVEADLSTRRFRERELYTIPISSSWFRWDDIHEYERRSLPEFFEGGSYSRSPRVYKEYRDFIINKFREDPSRRLTFTEVRKSLVGDVYTLQKVFIFLEKLGLVNFNLSGRKHQQHAEDYEPVVMVEDGPAAGVRVVPTLFSSSFAAPGQDGEEAPFKLPPLASYSDSFVELNSSSDLICGLCGGHYHSGLNESSEGDIKMCSKCSSKDTGNEKPELDLAQNKYTDAKDCSSTAWTDAETLLLLEAVLKHGEDWDLIAQHVRTKNKLDCISRLIHLPFGEHILGAIATKSSNINLITLLEKYKSGMQVLNDNPIVLTKIDGDEQVEISRVEEEERGSQEQPSNQKCFPPFIDAIDSFMKQVASLSTLCRQDVASAAVDAAIRALCQENPCARLAFETNGDKIAKSVIKFEDVDAKGNTHADYVPEKSFSAKTFQIRAGIAASLAVAAARAKLIADQEEREMELLMASIIQAQLKKLQHKMKHLKEAELIMEKELAFLQPMKESMIEEWVSVLHKLFQAETPRWRDQSFPKTMLHTFPL